MLRDVKEWKEMCNQMIMFKLCWDIQEMLRNVKACQEMFEFLNNVGQNKKKIWYVKKCKDT